MRGHGASSAASGMVNRIAINGAAAIAEATGKDLYFGPSIEDYTISGSIHARSNVKFYGLATIRADTVMTAAIHDPVGGDAENIHIEGLTFVGGVPDDNTLAYPRRERTKNPSFSSAIRITGDQAPGKNITRKVRNVTVRNVKIVGTQSLPILCEGVRGWSFVDSCDIYNTMDVGFVACDTVTFTNNKVERGADNGVSVSRAVGRAIIADNHFQDCAYFGIFCAGWVSATAEGGVSDPGPRGFTVTGNVVVNSGRGGICMTDGPGFGVVSGNVIDTVTQVPLDHPSDYSGGVGIIISGWPSEPYDDSDPTRYAEQIIIANNVLRNCASGGINLRGARNISIDGNMFVDIGTPTLTNGTVITPTDTSLNNGIYSGKPNTVSNLSVRNNDFIDTRATTIMNYAVIPQLVALTTTVIRGNTLRRLRQPLAEVVKADKVVPGDGRFNFAQDPSTGAMLLERRDAAGVRQDIPWQVSASNGYLTFNTYSSFLGGMSLADGTTLTVGAVAGGRIGGTTAKLGFFGATPIAKPALTYSRAGESAQNAAMRTALSSLGLVTDSTTT